ncbi:hypothetical protein ACFC09_35080 [Streptomyces sp. NPDC056161]|uniref:effector-associated constant component EACC1 n=1 Tax=Streptomyces sp. NPDC056161 TaxID=3345732 RepID=UPI0035DD6B73
MPEVHLAARSDRFDEDDDRWQSQVLLLYRALDDAAGPVERRSEPIPGAKGALSEAVLHLTGPGIAAGVVTALAAWLRRDRGRSVCLTWTVDGRRGEFTVTGASIDNDVLRGALEHGLRAAAGEGMEPAESAESAESAERTESAGSGESAEVVGSAGAPGSAGGAVIGEQAGRNGVLGG